MAAEPSNRRKDRLAAALKENLRRRKAQARAKAALPPKALELEAGLGDQPKRGLKNAPKNI